MKYIELYYSSFGSLMGGNYNGKSVTLEQISQIIFDIIQESEIPPKYFRFHTPQNFSSPGTIKNFLAHFSETYLRNLQGILIYKGINLIVKGDSYKYNLRENQMTNETLRMQMLSGIITESEYKAKLEETGMFNDPIGYEKSEPNPKDKIFTKEYKGNGMYVIYKNGKEVKTIEGEGNANAWINDEMRKLKENKKSLNENFVGMGMVGNIFDREKTDYELAFEHFTKGSLSESEEVEEANLNESALAIAGGIILGVLGLKPILRILKGISSAVSLAKMTDPKELKKAVAEIGKEAMQKGKNPLQIALWMSTVNSMIENGKIKNGISLAKTWGNIDKIDIEKAFSSSESEEVEEGKDKMPKAPSHEETDAAQVYEDELSEDISKVSIYQEGKKWIVAHPVATRLETKEFDAIEDAYEYYAKVKSSSNK